MPAALDQRSGASVLPVYLGLYLVLLAFFVYFVAVSAAERKTEAAVADAVAAGIAPSTDEVEAAPAPALRPLAEAFRPLALPGGQGERSEPDRLDVVVPVERIFAADTATPRPDFAAILDSLAKALTIAAATPAEGTGASGSEPLDLRLLVGLPAIDRTGGEPASVAAILAERLAVARAAAFARALLGRGTPPEVFAVGVAPGAGSSVRFLIRLDHRRAASLRD